jgi:hypothetical protein
MTPTKQNRTEQKERIPAVQGGLLSTRLLLFRQERGVHNFSIQILNMDVMQNSCLATSAVVSFRTAVKFSQPSNLNLSLQGSD